MLKDRYRNNKTSFLNTKQNKMISIEFISIQQQKKKKEFSF